MIDTTYLSTSELEEIQATDRLTNCELCNERFWQSSLAPHDGYLACEVCIENEKAFDIAEMNHRLGFNDACMKIYDMIRSGEIKEPIDILHLVKLK